MNRKIAHLLTYLYPRSWRARYGEEFEALLLADRGGLRTAINVFLSALRERIFPSRGNTMPHPDICFSAVAKQPSALIPMAMSLTALAVVLVHIALFGAAREPDEGPAAHIWQLLMAAQIPVLFFFAVKWLPKAPRQALCVLALQAGAVLASLAPIFFLNL